MMLHISHPSDGLNKTVDIVAQNSTTGHLSKIAQPSAA